MCRGEGGMTTERDLYRRSEPAERIPVKERGLREVHLGGHALHPTVGNGRVQQADGGRITLESCAGEGVDGVEAHGGDGIWAVDIKMQPGCKPYKLELGLGVSRGECGIVGYRPMCRDVPITVSS
ncbi:hypothetical protein GCM10009734_97200 [Nonomuraea bangladeshensis]